MDQTNRKSLKVAGELKMWRSLDELAQTPEFREMVGREFPDAAGEWDDAASRRTFLKVMGASLALAGIGVGGCVKPTTEQIVPYVRQPEEMTPGVPLYFATALTFRGYARGIVAESHEGRPTKIEGNRNHPSSLGSTDPIMQGHVLNLYDPDRSQIVNYAGEVSNWNTFTRTILAELESRKSGGGQGIRLLTGTVTSPTLTAQINDFIRQYPNVKWHQYEPVNNDNEKRGLQQAFGLQTNQFIQPVYRFDQAKLVVSLDCNFLTDLPGSVRYARDFVSGRRILPSQGKTTMNRLYVIESSPTIAGAYADERMRVKPSEILNIARTILAGNGTTEFLKNIAADLQKPENRGASIVIAGESQPPEVHAIAAALNSQLGNIGKTVTYVDSIEAAPQLQTDSLAGLVKDMQSNAVDVLIMIGVNPAYDAPANLKFADQLKDMSSKLGKRTVHMGLYYDETAFVSQWHLPLAHELEVWGDARAHDGTACIMQPLIAALYQGKSAHVLMAILLGQPNLGGYEILRNYWQANTSGDFETQWVQWLNDGVIPNTAAAPRNVTLAANATQQTATAAAGGKEIVFRPDPYIWDGRYANNGWLMETPRPITKLTWDNAALMSPKTAAQYGAISDDYTAKPKTPIVTLTANGLPAIRAALWVVAGHPDDVVTVHLGFGRVRAGRIGGNLDSQPGFNAYALRTSDNMWSAPNLGISETGDEVKLACTQNLALMDQNHRNLLHVHPIGREVEHEKPRTVSLSLYPPRDYPDDVRKGNKWGMVIDQNACIGCNACVMACNAENNIPIVGKDQVSRGRDMQWLRIDQYWAGETVENADGPYFQPLPCMHCENAPCEVVCPANATMHDLEGLNNMVYNRCIGTRYCSNNCPYKVRHFNFMQYSNTDVEVLKMAANPNVTVRSRGVMEKCTYCVQRINSARIHSKIEHVNGQRPENAIYDGEVVTACAQACPTQAIFFGNLNDNDLPSPITKQSGSVVARLVKEEGNYTLLDEELQTRPRTSYLPRYTNKANVAASINVGHEQPAHTAPHNE